MNILDKILLLYSVIAFCFFIIVAVTSEENPHSIKGIIKTFGMAFLFGIFWPIVILIGILANTEKDFWDVMDL